MSTMYATGHPATGEFSYNGVGFGGAERITCQMTPEFDDAGRTVKCVRHQYDVDAVIVTTSGGLTVDEKIETLKKKLLVSGAPLVVSGKGLGDLTVNAGGQGASVQDVAFGPNPLSLSVEPIGDARAVAVSFSIETRVAVCQSCQSCDNGVMALNYSMAFDVDKHGLLTRTIAGHVEVASNTIYGSRRITDDADRYATILDNFPHPGYERTSSRNLTDDKRRLIFTIKDQQIASRRPYPVGVTAISGKYRVAWSRTKGRMSRLTHTISMNVTPLMTLPPAFAYQVFLQKLSIVKGILERTNENVLLSSVSIEEDWYGLGMSFDVSIETIGPITGLAGSSALFATFGDDWRAHVASIQTAQRIRGISNYQHPTSMDRVVDLCSSQQQQQAPLLTFQYQGTPRFTNALINRKPPPDRSYTQYDSQINVQEDTGVSIHQPIGDEESSGGTGSTSGSSSTSPATPGGEEDITAAKDMDFSASSDGGSGGRGGQYIYITGSEELGYFAFWRGWAERVGYPIPKPKLEKVGKANATETFAEFELKEPRVRWGLLVYRAKWDITYVLDRNPGKVVPLPNALAALRAGENPPKPKP